MQRVSIWSALSAPMAVPFRFTARARTFTFEPRLLLMADAAGGGGTGDPAKGDDKGADYWQKEAKAAFQARDEAKKVVADLSTKFDEVQKQLKAINDEKATRDAEAAKKSEEDRVKQLEKEGKYKQILDESESKHKAETEAIRQTASQRLLSTAIAAAAGQVENLTPEARGDLPFLLRDTVRVNPQTFEVEVLGEDGKPAQTLKENKLVPVPVVDFLKGFVSKRPYMLLDAMQKGSGAGPGDSTTLPKGLTMEEAIKDQAKLEAWQKADPKGFEAAQKEYFSMTNQAARAAKKLGG